MTDFNRFFGGSPNISAVPMRPGNIGTFKPLLSEEDRLKLASIASVRHYNASDCLIHEDDEATCLLNIASGVVKAFNFMPNGKKIIQGFFSANDLIGFAENGRYINTVKAITPVTAFHLPISALETLLRSNPNLHFYFLTKTIHELWLARQHAIVLSQSSAKKRLLMLINLLKMHGESSEQKTQQIHLPMSRADIANYAGLAIETVSRNLNQLNRQGIIRLVTPQCVELTDENTFEAALLSEH